MHGHQPDLDLVVVVEVQPIQFHLPHNHLHTETAGKQD
jgi:hypothetical protein